MSTTACNPVRGAAAPPPDEQARLAAVRRYEILDTPADGAFDRITALAAKLLDVPIAIASIVDSDRIWFKSHHGLDAEQVDRDPGLCASAILRYEPLVIPDARLDPVALSNPLVAGELGLRFYAAVPLTTADRHNLGTLCVIDRQPRELDERQVSILEDLAGLVVRELELRLQARRAVAHQAALREEAVERERYAADLAQTLQRSLLPPALPRIPGVELAARYRPLDRSRVGGDFYDLFALPGEQWGLVIGDVCGKGPEAAALTAAARWTVRAAALEHTSPAAVLHAVNEALLTDAARDGRFCTLIYARLRVTGPHAQCALANGGHPPPRVLRADGAVEVLRAPGPLVGLLPDAHFTDGHASLDAGDAMVLFTDGLTEARTGASTPELLGSAAVEDLLRDCRGESADQIADRLQDAARPTRDDLAILVARVAG